ncbi:MAG TPA: guanylate kinase [Mycobacteriales bacterium]|jgi:guanylate kinase|nr:guanylate kinase [Mycobacteriales bacterium]
MTSRLTVLSGPAGVGKSSIVEYLREHHPEVWHSVSVTTRPQRPGEIDGVNYHFADAERFAAMVRDGELLEHAQYAGNWYGTPRAPVTEHLDRGELVLLEVELQGARQVRTLMPDGLQIFLAPPSWEELERRLRGRGTEPADVIERRLATARIELAAEDEFDETIVNTSVPEAAETLVRLMKAS